MSAKQTCYLVALMCVLATLTTSAYGKKVCYSTVGCFSNKKPYSFAMNRLPSPLGSVDTRFRLYTRRKASGSGELLTYEGNAINGLSAFDPKLPVKFIVHGFSKGTEPWMLTMKNALLKELPCNVILVDWTKGARQPRYFRAAANTRLVGRQIALLIKKLVRSGSSLGKIHLIGLSLGAHVCGFAGSELNGAVARISGLDPAGPLFDRNSPLIRLDSSDAQFVDVIHTNGVPLLKGGYGLTVSVGHVDFYPNGGKWQPGCHSLAQTILMKMKPLRKNVFNWSSGCHHVRSVDLYTESIQRHGCLFIAHRCPGGYKDYLAGKCGNCSALGCSEMGYHADKYSTRGDMYLRTHGSAPFCKP